MLNISLGKSLKKALGKLKKIYLYFKVLKGKSLLICVLDEIFCREVLRNININGTTLLIRTYSPDINVAASSFINKEYDDIVCLAPNIIVDAGANIGTSAICFAQKYPSAKIFAIEPEDSNFKILRENTEIYPNIFPIKAAIWGTIEKRTLQDRNTGYWGYTVSDTDPINPTSPLQEQIDCITIKSLMDQFEITKIDLLKMDIEGGEKNVLENSLDWIDSVDVLTIELHDRICMGCSRAFYLATKDFKKFEKQGEKITAYKN